MQQMLWGENRQGLRRWVLAPPKNMWQSGEYFKKINVVQIRTTN